VDPSARSFVLAGNPRSLVEAMSPGGATILVVDDEPVVL
jgi:hypothetical protein